MSIKVEVEDKLRVKGEIEKFVSSHIIKVNFVSKPRKELVVTPTQEIDPCPTDKIKIGRITIHLPETKVVTANSEQQKIRTTSANAETKNTHQETTEAIKAATREIITESE